MSRKNPSLSDGRGASAARARPGLQSFACALLLVAASTLASEPISVAETRTLALTASGNAATHDLSLDLYRFRGSR